jgi:hypothetical protein
MGQVCSFCLFRCEEEPLAVRVDDVAEVLEVDAFVRISLCPPLVVGLCPYHREVAPVVTLGNNPDHSRREDGRDGSSGSPKTVLILQTSQGVWGIWVRGGVTVVSGPRPVGHEPLRRGGGAVIVGSLMAGGTSHSVLDPEATWRELRGSVEAWYGTILESGNTFRVAGSHESAAAQRPTPAPLASGSR